MSENPQGEPTPEQSGRRLGDSLRAKLEEYQIDRHIDELAETVEHAVRQGVGRVGELAHEHRGDIDRLLDKAAGAVDRRTDGKHAATINQVRGTLDRGVERIADHRPGPTDVPPDAPGETPGGE
jgi:hypothetical protein